MVTSQPNTPGSIQVGCCNAVKTSGRRRAGREDGPGRWDRVPRDAHQAAARGELEHDHRRRRRSDRREPARVGAVPRRADDRGDERARARRHRRRQPRVRRGRERAPAHAERRLPPGRRLPGRRRLRRRASSSTSRRTCSTQGTDQTILPPYEVEKIDNAKIAFIGLTLEGTPTIVTPSASPASSSGRRSRRSTRSSRSSATSRASRRSSCSCTRAACRTRRAGVPGAGEQPDAYMDVNSCVNFSGPRSRRSRTASIRASRS